MGRDRGDSFRFRFKFKRSWDSKSSIQIAEGEVVLVEAEEVAEFVEVGGADLLGEDGRIALGQVPEVVEVEDDAGGWLGGKGIGFQAAGALEKTEEVGLKALVEDGLVGGGLVEGDNGLGGGAKVGGQAGADAIDARRCELV